MTLNNIAMSVILMSSLIFTFASANTCGARCNRDSDCYQGGFVQCGKCNLYQGTLGYKTCYNNRPEPPTPAPAHDYFPIGGSCSNWCRSDRDCQNGGFNPCGKCGHYAGTIMYQRCYQPDQKRDRLLENTCGASCDSDRDCNQGGGFLECGKCNLYQGTLGYKTCYNDQQPEPPTPAPTHDYFPHGGSCRNKCETNADCQNGGFNPCGKCGQVEGTEMYHVCYQPTDEGRNLRGSM
jgi:hypothetical protein